MDMNQKREMRKNKKINIEQLDRKMLNELIDMIYIIDKNNIKIEFENI